MTSCTMRQMPAASFAILLAKVARYRAESRPTRPATMPKAWTTLQDYTIPDTFKIATDE